MNLVIETVIFLNLFSVYGQIQTQAYRNDTKIVNFLVFRQSLLSLLLEYSEGIEFKKKF